MKLKRTITVVLATIIVCSVSILLSYRNARNTADEMMKPFLRDKLYYYGTTFYPVMFNIKDHEIQNWMGPHWQITYDFQSALSGPLSFQINLFGKIIGTNPRNLREIIIPNYLIKLK